MIRLLRILVAAFRLRREGRVGYGRCERGPVWKTGGER